jgi:hypothetical protein
MKGLRYIYVWVLVGLVASLTKAQDAKADFKKINAMYYAVTQMQLHFKHELYFDDATKPKEVENGVYKRGSGSYYLKQSGSEVVLTKNHVLVIDNDQHTMILDKTNPKTKILNPLNVNLDSLFKIYSSVKFYKTGSANQWHAYSFTLKEGMYSSIDIVFDPVTYRVKEISNVYRDKMPDENEVMHVATLKTVFVSFDTAPVPASDFNISNYVVVSDKKLKPISKYNKYKLLTNLKTL